MQNTRRRVKEKEKGKQDKNKIKTKITNTVGLPTTNQANTDTNNHQPPKEAIQGADLDPRFHRQIGPISNNMAPRLRDPSLFYLCQRLLTDAKCSVSLHEKTCFFFSVRIVVIKLAGIRMNGGDSCSFISMVPVT